MLLATILSVLYLLEVGSSDSGLVASLQQTYHTGCVHVVTSPGNSWRATRLCKTLAMTGTMTSVGGVDEIEPCRYNRPLYILYGDGETRRRLEQQQISSYPRWLLFLDESASLEEYFSSIHIPFDCEFLVARQQSEQSAMLLTEVYRLAEDMPLNAVHYGSWDSETGLNATRLYLYDRRNNLEGLVLRFTSITPGEGIFDGATQYKEHYTSVWKILEEKLRFKSLRIPPEFEHYGLKQANGSWLGMMRSLVDHVVHIGVGDFSITKERIIDVDYLTCHQVVRNLIYVRRLTVYEVDNSFSTFKSSLWLAILATIFLTALVRRITSRVRRKQQIVSDEVTSTSSLRVDTDSAQVETKLSLAHSFFQIFSLFCQQDPVLKRESDRSMLLLFAGMTSLILTAAYSAGLTSTTAVKRSQLPFDTIQGLLDDGSYVLGVPRNSLHVYFDLNATDSKVNNLYRKHVEPYLDSFPNFSGEGMRLLCQREKFAWITGYKFGNGSSLGLECEIAFISEDLGSRQESFIIQKRSPYRKIFNHYLGILRYNGVFGYLRRKQFPDFSLSLDAPAVPKLDILQVSAIFIVLAIGVLASALMLLLELTTFHGKKRL